MREGWETVRVSDIATVRSGATPSTKDPGNWDGDIPWLTPKDLSERPAKYTERGNRSITEQGLKKTALLPAGSVLLTSRAPVGYVSIAKNEISTNQGFKSLILKSGHMPEYWYYLLQSSTDYLLDNSGGSTFKEISKKSVENLQFPVPPLHEQRRIVDLMDSVDAAISAAQAEVDAAASLRTKVLEHELGNLGEDWGQTTLGEVSQRTIGRTPPRKQAKYWSSDTHFPFCTIKAMQDRSTMEFSEGVTEEAIHDKVAKLAPKGSLLLSFKLSIGRVRIAPRDVYFNEAIAWIRPIEDRVTRDFLALALEGVDWDSLGSRAVKGKTLNSQSLDAVPLDLPPLHEQQRIVDTMSSIDASVSSAQSVLDSLREMRSSMLSVLLSGEHEIPETYDQFLDLSEEVQTG